MTTGQPASRAVRGFRPPALVLVVAIAAVLLLLVVELALGRIHLRSSNDPEIVFDVWIAISHIVVLAYAMGAGVMAQRVTERDVRALAALGARVEPSPDAWRRRRRRLLGAGLVGVIASFAITSQSPDFVSFADGWTPETAWHRALAPLLGFFITRLIALVILDSQRISQAADTIDRVDLLDLTPLAFFARHGQANALLFLGLLSAYSLFLVDLRYLWIFALVLAFAVPGTIAAFALPLRGARRLIGRSKARELAFCRDEMRRARSAFGSGGAANERARLGELVAWEARIEAVREWPFDAGALMRLVLYLLLPLGSWAGAALVERTIDTLLD